ncbi:PREDICTED: DNA mismatch repair protein spellchecker 1 isoform X1 [Rhagoletis zephyria]|uniref:DNA mismatch repair protein spellchecker 1 isoform X1 n=1 Tax=Rhagoletis zephyria TaxID=28612 RepID=UPI00081170C3|nr:PREDICTED: DNA mismatch repair protein spellchecker 1 isoform X1 [Rhagoletis zephyria]
MEVINANRQEPQLNLDINAQRNFIKYYAKSEDKPPTTVRFFDRIDFYTVHGTDDCELIAKLIYKSTAFVHKLLPDESDALSYVTLSKANFNMAVRELLLVRNFRVEVYVRPVGAAAASNNWELEYRGSPGNLIQFEEILFGNREILVSNNLLSLQVRLVDGNQRRLGVAFVEQNDCQFHVLEFIDNDFFTELEAMVVLLGPKECLLPAADGEYIAVRQLLERNNVGVTVPKRSAATPADKNDLLQDLNRLIRFAKGQQEDALTLPEMQLTMAMEALRVAIKYLNLTNDASNLGHYEIKQLNLKRFVHLDSAAVAALNILPKPGTNPNSPGYHWQSILGVLDHCRTPQGHRLLAQWIKQPLRSIEILNDRHDIVQCLLESPGTLTTLHDDYLKRIPDVLMLTKRLLRQKANMQDLFRVYQVVLRTPRIVNTLLSLEHATVKNVLCDAMKSYLEDLSGFKQLVEQVVDFEAIEAGDYLVKASFDEQLQDMKNHMSRVLSKMERLQQKAADDLNMEKSQVRLENVAKIGYHFRVTLKDDSELRKNKNYKILDVVKGGVRFTNEKLTEYSEEYGTFCDQYEEQQKSVVEEIIKVAIGYAGPLSSLNNELAQLDCLVSFAMAALAAPTPYMRPKMLKEGAGVLELKDLRHPCLELQEHVTFIANNVAFEKDACNMFIITGPNMGGKSTYIRSVGTAVLMAHVGAFVPCSEATITMVDSILGRVGASDNIVKGLSTFMVEMIETSGIVRTATENSLVIIDELGRGTSTYEGCGIAWSIAEHLAKVTKCFTLFATHFHEITNLAKSVDTVKNCHMAAVANAENFTLLYQVCPGIMEKSFGIQVARLANFPEAVVHNAQRIYREFEDEYADKQSEADKELLDKIDAAVERLTTTGNDVDIDEAELSKLVATFAKDIKQLDSEYFRTVLSVEGN